MNLECNKTDLTLLTNLICGIYLLLLFVLAHTCKVSDQLKYHCPAENLLHPPNHRLSSMMSGLHAILHTSPTTQIEGSFCLINNLINRQLAHCHLLPPHINHYNSDHNMTYFQLVDVYIELVKMSTRDFLLILASISKFF